MNKETLLERKKQLEKDIVASENQRLQIVANINALGGAIQEVEFWLSKLDEKKVK